MEYSEYFQSLGDKLQAEYNLEIECIKLLINDSSQIDQGEIDKRLLNLASLKMKIDVLRGVSDKLRKDNQRLLFG